MPHLKVEYSGNLEPRIDFAALLRSAHEAAFDVGCFAPNSIRSRAVRRDVFVVGDGDPANAFVHVEIRIRPGRSAEQKHRLVRAVFEHIWGVLEPVHCNSPVGLTVEVQEIDIEFRLFRENFEEHADARASAKSNG